MRRKIYERLLQWKQEKDGTTALMIEGARRVGKSYWFAVERRPYGAEMLFLRYGPPDFASIQCQRHSDKRNLSETDVRQIGD